MVFKFQDSSHFEKHFNVVDKLLVANVKFMLGVLGLEKSGDRVNSF